MDYCDSCEKEISESQAIRFDGFCCECYDNAEWFSYPSDHIEDSRAMVDGQ